MRQGRDVRLALRDPEGLAEGVLVATPALALLLGFLDGTRTTAEVSAAWEEATGQALPVAEVERVVDGLDSNLLLEGGRADAARTERLAAYRARGVRPAAHAGQSYPEEKEPCEESLRRHVRDAGSVSPPAHVRAVLAPHIDLRGGGPCHGAAALAIARSPATTFVVLGTAHAALRRPFALTSSAYDTPLGTLETDRDLVARLSGRAGGSLLDDELAHASEHSVEFQALWIRHLHRDRPGLRIVPVLVGSLHEHVAAGTSPRDDARVSDFVGALREVLAERGDSVALVGSIDLAHVGPRYGDPAPPDEEALARVREADERLLAAALAADGDAWIRSLQAHGDAHHVCGTAAAYVLLRAIEGEGLSARVLRHDRWEIDPDTGSHVSFAAVAYGRDGAGNRPDPRPG